MSKKTNQVKMYRQGDVLLVKVGKAKKGKVVALDNGVNVLAYGEVTGHAHTISGNHSTLFECEATAESKEAERFLHVEEATDLNHQEHGTINIPEGDYKVIIQQEYHPEEIRKVRD